MPLGEVSHDVSSEGIAFAKQSFRHTKVDALIASNPEYSNLYSEVKKGIVSNVKSQPGGFKATSGVVLPYYLNLSTNFMDPAVAPKLLKLVSETLLRIVLAELVPAEGEKIAIIGMEVAGGMLVSQLAAAGNEELIKHFDFIYMRKNRKTTGTAQQLEAQQKFTTRTAASASLRAVWVDDCNSTGSSLCEGIKILEEDYNINVVKALYVVDRSADRQNLDNNRQKLSDERFVSGRTSISSIMDLQEIDALVPRT